MELNIKDFDDLENYFKKKAQHVEELENENIELTLENRQLKREIREIEDLCLKENRKLEKEIRELKVERAKFINELASIKKSPAATEDEITKYFNDISIPHEMRGREQ